LTELLAEGSQLVVNHAIRVFERKPKRRHHLLADPW
jgi:hypothetical protein